MYICGINNKNLNVMEEILFRAKRVDNGKLIYGSLIRSFEAFHISDDYFKPSNGEHPELIDIDDKTISQFTGVLDKNKTKVFENDKVLVHENVCGEIKDWTAKVVFIAGSFCLVNEDGNPICNLGDVCGTFEVIHE